MLRILLFFMSFLVACGTPSEQDPDLVLRNPSCQGPGNFRVMTFNIHTAKDRKGRDTLKNLQKFLSNSDADIIFLQELDEFVPRSFGHDQLGSLQNIDIFPYAHFSSTVAMDTGLYGIGILSRYPLEAREDISLDIAPSKQSPAYEKRGALYARITVKGQKIHLINTHLHYEPEARDAQWEVLRKQILARSGDKSSVIFGGDLNAEPDSPTVLSASALFSDSWASFKQRFDRPQTDGLFKQIDKPYIDYLFTRDLPMPCSGSRLGAELSDHQAYSIDLQL